MPGGAIPGGGNCMPPGGEPAGPPGGGNPGGMPCGRAGRPVNLSESMSFARDSKSNTYRAGSWACQEVVGNLVAGLVGAAA